MSRRPPPYWLNRGGAPSAKSKAAASSRDAAIQSFNSFYAQLLREQHDGFTESKGGGGDDDGDGDDAAGKRKAAAFSQQMRERVLRFFMRGSKESAYYTVHGAAAYFVADEYFNTRVEMRFLGDDRLAWLNLRPAKVASIVSDAVQVKKMQVEVWDKQQGQWICTLKGSPTHTEELEEMMGARHEEGALIMAVTLTIVNQQRMVGVAMVDSLRHRLEVAEFSDDSTFSTLESILLQHSPRSCIVQDKKSNTNNDVEKMDEVLARTDTARETSKLTVGYKEVKFLPDLAQVVDDVGRYTLMVSSQPYAMSALASLLHSLSLSSSSASSHKFGLYAFSVHEHVKLDHSSFSALNLFPASTVGLFSLSPSASFAAPSAPDDLSIFSFLNRTKTPMGARLLSRFIRQPLLSLQHIQLRHELVAFFVQRTSIRSHLRDSSTCLRRCPDIESVLRKLQRQRGKNAKKDRDRRLLDVVRLYQVVVKLGVMRQALQGELSDEGSALVRTRYVVPLQECEVEMAQFVAMCDRAIDMELSEKTWYQECAMRGDFSPDLKQLEQRKATLRRSMEAMHRQVEEELGLAGKVHLDFVSCLMRITNKEESRARLQPPYLIVDSKKDGTRFTTQPFKQLAVEYKAVVSEYSARQEVYVDKLVDTTLTYAPVVERMSGLIAELDVLVAFAHVAASLEGFVRPTMRELGSGVLRMKASRHPLLESGNAGLLRSPGDDDGMQAMSRSFIPNDVDMVQGVSHCQIITGPNMGGKSTYIRQIGICSLLAQVGMFVPAQSAELTIVDAILCRIGAGDIQSKGVSTFMQEMLETAQILHLSTPHSLVIVDEMGRGTSTEDGLGLAWATAEFIARRGGFSLFATHFHEMKQLADEGVGAVNRHVTAVFKAGVLEYLYEVREGASEESFGVECMHMAKLDPRIVSDAREKLKEFEEERRRKGVGGGRDEAEELKRRTGELQLRVERLRADAVRLSEADRAREKVAIRAEAAELQRRLQQSMGKAAEAS